MLNINMQGKLSSGGGGSVALTHPGFLLLRGRRTREVKPGTRVFIKDSFLLCATNRQLVCFHKYSTGKRKQATPAQTVNKYCCVGRHKTAGAGVRTANFRCKASHSAVNWTASFGQLKGYIPTCG